MTDIRLSKISKSFGKIEVVHGIDLEIAAHEFVVLVGPSGCGKSTTLRMIAGLEEISGGDLTIGDRVVNEMAPKDRDVAMVFQNYALYPHLSVAKNIAFGLNIRRVPKDEVKRQVEEVANILELTELLERKPAELSGGQRQRVAMGRAIVRDPAVFLFDEPLSNLDAKLRLQMRAEIKLLHKRLNATSVYVTHDQVEAMTLADRIVVMQDGRIEQVGKPMDLFRNPASLFVAGFIGSPPMNLLTGNVDLSGSTPTMVTTDNVGIPVRRSDMAGISNNTSIVVGVRPEHVHLEQDEQQQRIAVPCVTELVEPLGSEALLHTKVGNVAFIVKCETHGDIDHLASVDKLYIDGKDVHSFDSDSGVALTRLQTTATESEQS
jgi:multiple sugar transport system ATP-binding protein